MKLSLKFKSNDKLYGFYHAVIFQKKGAYISAHDFAKIPAKELQEHVIWNEDGVACVELVESHGIQMRVVGYNNFGILIRNRGRRCLINQGKTRSIGRAYRGKRNSRFLKTYEFEIYPMPNIQASFIPWNILRKMIYNSKEFIPIYKQQANLSSRYNKKNILMRSDIGKVSREFDSRYKTVLGYCRLAEKLMMEGGCDDDFKQLEATLKITGTGFMEFVAQSRNDMKKHQRKIFQSYSNYMTAKEIIDLGK